MHMRSFQYLSSSNISRGVQAGVVYYIISIGLTRFPNQANMASMLSGCVACAPFLSYLLLTILCRRKKACSLYFMGGIIACGAMLFLAVNRQPFLYAAAYFILLTGESLIDQCYPLGMYEVVPLEVLGRFSAARLLIYTFTSMISTYVCGFLIESGATTFIFFFGAVTALFSGWNFYKTLKNNQNYTDNLNKIK